MQKYSFGSLLNLKTIISALLVFLIGSLALVIISILLFPFTFIFLCLSSLNNSLKKKYFLKVPTIFIGNIYVGGTGKTPLSIHIFKLLKKKGWKPAIIKKFYKNHIDEVNLIRQKVNSLFTGKNRVDLSEEAIRKGHRLLIFDDGLQDASINKDLKIICFNLMIICNKWHMLAVSNF